MYGYAWLISGTLLVGSMLFRSWLLTAGRYERTRRRALLTKRVRFQWIEAGGLLLLAMVSGMMILTAVTTIREFRNIENDMGQVSDSVQLLADGNNAERVRIENDPEWEYLTYNGDLGAVELIDTFKNVIQKDPTQYNQLAAQLNTDLSNILTENGVTESELVWVGKTVQLDGEPYCLAAGIVPSQNQLFRQKLAGPCDLKAEYGNIAAAGTGSEIVEQVTRQSVSDVIHDDWLLAFVTVLLSVVAGIIIYIWVEFAQEDYLDNKNRKRNNEYVEQSLNPPELLTYSGNDPEMRNSLAKLQRLDSPKYCFKDRQLTWSGAGAGSIVGLLTLTIVYNSAAAPSWALLAAGGLGSMVAGLTAVYGAHRLHRAAELYEQRESVKKREQLLNQDAETANWRETILMRYSNSSTLVRSAANLMRTSNDMHLKLAAQVEPNLLLTGRKLTTSLNGLLTSMETILTESGQDVNRSTQSD